MKSKIFLSLFSVLFLFLSCAGAAKTGVNTGVGTGRAPAWITSVDSVYSRSRYVAAVGSATDRDTAEKNALAALVSFFGQSVQVERNASSSYRQAIANGVVDGWIDTAQLSSTIKTQAFQDNLLGAEIDEVWFDSRDTYYAVAVMDKARSAGIYNQLILANLNLIKNLLAMAPNVKDSLEGVIRYRFAAEAADVNVSNELIRANLNLIKNLLAMTPNEKYSLEGVIRYSFAAEAADINVPCANIVRLLDSSPPNGVVSGDEYRLEARNIAKMIPIGITVTYDRQGRIFGAFAKCFTDIGFETNTGGSRYVLDVNSSVSPVDLPANQNYFTRIEIAANLTDTDAGLVLLPYNFNTREGHVSQSEADNRAIAAAQRNISEEFAVVLSDYLSQLMPR